MSSLKTFEFLTEDGNKTPHTARDMEQMIALLDKLKQDPTVLGEKGIEKRLKRKTGKKSY
ncbi:MAG: hypothetical protein EDM72_15280 [Chlorobiota bacterium]|nr:MAG: hypothetical protein EDM72_15280 [Chlorobiota bacterium]